MPTYEYLCKDCGSQFDVIKSIKDYDLPESCHSCQSLTTVRQISRTHFYGASDWDSASYNPAFGKVIKNKKHRDEEAKRLGLIEVGNEDLEKTTASQDKRLDDNINESMKDAYESLEYGLKTDYLSKR